MRELVKGLCSRIRPGKKLDVLTGGRQDFFNVTGVYPRIPCTGSSVVYARRWRRPRIRCTGSYVVCARRWRSPRIRCTCFCVCRAGISSLASSPSPPPATSVLLVAAAGHCSLLLRKCQSDCEALLAAAGHCSLLLRKCQSDCEAP
jgi:hypothetical protein